MHETQQAVPVCPAERLPYGRHLPTRPTQGTGRGCQSAPVAPVTAARLCAEGRKEAGHSQLHRAGLSGGDYETRQVLRAPSWLQPSRPPHTRLPLSSSHGRGGGTTTQRRNALPAPNPGLTGLVAWEACTLGWSPRCPGTGRCGRGPAGTPAPGGPPASSGPPPPPSRQGPPPPSSSPVEVLVQVAAAASSSSSSVSSSPNKLDVESSAGPRAQRTAPSGQQEAGAPPGESASTGRTF